MFLEKYLKYYLKYLLVALSRYYSLNDLEFSYTYKRSIFLSLQFYKKNTSISIKNTGIKIHSDQPIYPKKDGIRIPFSSEIDFTIKFGAFPM